MISFISDLLVDLIGHLSFVITAMAYFMRDMLILRSLAVLSGLVAIVYIYLISGPLTVLFWQFILLGVNGWQIFSLLRERRNISFSEEERELFQTVFSHFAPVEFMKIMRIGVWKAGEPGDILATKDEPIDDIMVIYNGEVAILKGGAEVALLRDGTWIGEMSYLQGGNASATVRVARRTRYVSWHKDELTSLMKRNPTMDVAMKSVLSSDLINKLSL